MEKDEHDNMVHTLDDQGAKGNGFFSAFHAIFEIDDLKTNGWWSHLSTDSKFQKMPLKPAIHGILRVG